MLYQKSTSLIKTGFILYCIILSVQLITKNASTFNNTIVYEHYFTGWNYADWLINYESGFVRRGMLGEVILSLYEVTGVDVALMIHIIVIITTLLLITTVIYIFYKKKLSMFILPTIVMLGSFVINDINSFRRDALMLLLIFIILYIYKRYTDCRNAAYYILFSVLGIATLLMHEGSFFCFVPFLLLHRCFSKKNNVFGSITNSLAFVLPLIITMGVVCLFKGDTETANAIWASWQPAFVEYYGTQLPMSEAVNALTWETLPTMDYHFTTNYRGRVYRYIPKLFAWIAIYLSTFYLCANVNSVKMFCYEDKKTNYTSLTSILIIQFISLLPMFTVLSCDLGRIILYWTLTSFFIFFFFGNEEEKYSPRCLTKLSCKIGNLFNTKILSNRLFYIFATITIICPLVFFPFPEALYTSVIGNLYKIAQQLYALI